MANLHLGWIRRLILLSAIRQLNWRQAARWTGVALSSASVVFALLAYFGFWSWWRGDDLLQKLASRLDTSYADVSRQVRPSDPEWKPLLRVVFRYSTAVLPRDRAPHVFGRMKSVADAPPDPSGAEWTAPTTKMVLMYKDWPGAGNLLPGKDWFAVGTLGDLHDWIRRDEADFDTVWRTLIFGGMSACLALFLALPEKKSAEFGKPLESDASTPLTSEKANHS